jgi:drug/metabolite transporter (DMT)-like permease
MISLTLGTLVYSVGPVLIQSSSASGPLFSLWRLIVGIPIFAVPLVFYIRMGGRWPARRAWRWAVWAGLAFGTHQVLFMTAIKATSVTDVTLMGTLAPVVTAILAVPLFGERPGPSFRVWTLIAMIGMAIVILGGSSGPEGDPLGMAMAALNVIFFATFFIISKMSRSEIDVLPLLFGLTVVAAIVVGAVNIVTSVATGNPLQVIGLRDLILAVAVALIPGGLAHFMTTWSMRWVPANVPAVMQLTIPAVSGFLAWWLLGEGIRIEHLIGGALTLAGVAGAVLSPKGRAFAMGAHD